MKIDDICKTLELHSDRVRRALNAIPGEILITLPDYQITELVQRIDAHGKRCWDEGFEQGKAAK